MPNFKIKRYFHRLSLIFAFLITFSNILILRNKYLSGRYPTLYMYCSATMIRLLGPKPVPLFYESGRTTPDKILSFAMKKYKNVL